MVDQLLAEPLQLNGPWVARMVRLDGIATARSTRPVWPHACPYPWNSPIFRDGKVAVADFASRQVWTIRTDLGLAHSSGNHKLMETGTNQLSGSRCQQPPQPLAVFAAAPEWRRLRNTRSQYSMKMTNPMPTAANRIWSVTS